VDVVNNMGLMFSASQAVTQLVCLSFDRYRLDVPTGVYQPGCTHLTLFVFQLRLLLLVFA
jgi:hypothetical protein